MLGKMAHQQGDVVRPLAKRRDPNAVLGLLRLHAAAPLPSQCHGDVGVKKLIVGLANFHAPQRTIHLFPVLRDLPPLNILHFFTHELDNSSSTGLRLNYSTTRAL